MKYKNAQENLNGTVDCLILLGDEWVAHTKDPLIKYTLHPDSDWPETKPIDPSKLEAYILIKAEQEKQNKLAALDLPSWKLALAISGDEQALTELAESEAAKALIRV